MYKAQFNTHIRQLISSIRLKSYVFFKSRPLRFFVIYILLTVFYAVAYRYIPDAVKDTEFTFIKSIYFSTVTITTLGYGDITPKSNLAMIAVASEALAGIVVIGLFLNSLASEIEAKQDEAIKRRNSEQNRHRLASFYKYLSVIIADYQTALLELTTPMNKRSELLNSAPNPDFIFSDLQDIHGHSMLAKNGLNKPVFCYYYEKLDLLLNELKFLLANFDLIEYPSIHEMVLEFLSMSKVQDVREALYSYGKTTETKDLLAGLIKKYDQCPDIETHRGSIIIPVILLYDIVKFQVEQIKSLKDEFEKLIV